jgi:hypothetical protein
MGNETSKYLKRVEDSLAQNKEGYSQTERETWAKLFKKYDEDNTNYLYDVHLELFLGDIFAVWISDDDDESTRQELVKAFKNMLDKNGDGKISLLEFTDAIHEIYYKFHIEHKSLADIETEYLEKHAARKEAISFFDKGLVSAIKHPICEFLTDSRWIGSMIQHDGTNIYYQLTIRAASDGKLFGSHTISEKEERIMGALRVDRASVFLEYRTHIEDTKGDYILVRGKWSLNGDRKLRGTHVQVEKKELLKTIDTVEKFSGSMTLKDTENPETKGTLIVEFSEKLMPTTVKMYDDIDYEPTETMDIVHDINDLTLEEL